MPESLDSAFQDDITDHPLIVETSDEAAVLVDGSDEVEEVDILDQEPDEDEEPAELSTSSSEDEDSDETYDYDDE